MMSLHSEANDADDDLVKFLEAEVLAQDVDEESQHNGQENSTSSSTKCIHLEECKLEVDIEEIAENDVGAEMKSNVEASGSSSRHFKRKRYMENGPFSKIPTEIYPHIFKFLSPEDLVNCALVCRFMRAAASEESLWQRLYCMRWGLPQPDHGKLRACAWKKLYIEFALITAVWTAERRAAVLLYRTLLEEEECCSWNTVQATHSVAFHQVLIHYTETEGDPQFLLPNDEFGKGFIPFLSMPFPSTYLAVKLRDTVDMMEFVRGCPVEFQEYYIQMQAAKRSDAPLRSMLKDDIMILDTTVGDQINQWKQRHGLPDVFTGGHLCSGSTCTYSQVGDIFLCEKTGFVHVCDHTCRETVVDADSQLLVCLISGRCSVHWISTAEEEVDPGHQQGDYAAGDEAEPLTGDGQLARAYLLGYNCNDEKELEDALREVIYPGSNRI